MAAVSGASVPTAMVPIMATEYSGIVANLGSFPTNYIRSSLVVYQGRSP